MRQLNLVAIKTERLDVFLRTKLPDLLKNSGAVSNSKIRRLVIAGMVKVDGKQVRIPAYTLHKMCSVTVSVDSERFFYERQADDITFEVTQESVLYEDEAVIVVNKPSRFPTEQTIVNSRDNLHDAVVRYLYAQHPALRNPPYVGIMHRLDRETSGVILFTKQRTVNSAVHDMFEKHTIQKVYRAVSVVPQKNPLRTFSADTYTARISPKSSAAKWGSVPQQEGGVRARTDFTLIGTDIIAGQKVLLIEARPLTGRTHQIRVHLAGLGMPILGDILYGAPAFNRLMLHAWSLTFPHPVTGRIICVTAPLPEGFGKIL